MSPEAKVLGFVILMIVIFLGAYKAGSLAGPVIPAHTPVSTPGGGQKPSMNMNMGTGQLGGYVTTRVAGSPVTWTRP